MISRVRFPSMGDDEPDVWATLQGAAVDHVGDCPRCIKDELDKGGG